MYSAFVQLLFSCLAAGISHPIGHDFLYAFTFRPLLDTTAGSSACKCTFWQAAPAPYLSSRPQFIFISCIHNLHVMRIEVNNGWSNINNCIVFNLNAIYGDFGGNFGQPPMFALHWGRVVGYGIIEELRIAGQRVLTSR